MIMIIYNIKIIIQVRVTFDGTLSFRRKCLKTCCAVISWDRTDRRLVELQEMSSKNKHVTTGRRLVQFENSHVPIVISCTCNQSNAHLVAS